MALPAPLFVVVAQKGSSVQVASDAKRRSMWVLPTTMSTVVATGLLFSVLGGQPDCRFLGNSATDPKW